MKRIKIGKKTRVAVSLLIVLALFFLSVSLITKAIKPFAESLMKSQANIMCTLAINNAVLLAMTDKENAYDNLVSIIYDNSGRIVALKTDAAAINALQARVTNAVNNALSELPDSRIGIPVGSITGWEWLSGRGPHIYLKMIPSSYASSSIEHTFESAGVSQTRHQIKLHFQVKLTALLAPYYISTEVTTSVCIAETVIVGAVPEMFAGIE